MASETKDATTRGGVINDGGPAFPKCSRCDSPYFRKQGNQRLCVMHYRFSTMRQRARRDGKAVPTWEQLDNLHSHLVDMACPHCKRKMNWRTIAGYSTVVTLQHYRSGSMGLICLACNTRHGVHPGDTFNDIANTDKRCAKCSRVLSRSCFAADRSRPIGLKAWCRACSSSAHKSWRAKHACA